MPDGKVDKVVGNKSEWHAPVYGVDIRASFSTSWQSLQHWNNATVGVGLGYWNMRHQQLGHAITPYIYMDIAKFVEKNILSNKLTLLWILIGYYLLVLHWQAG